MSPDEHLWSPSLGKDVFEISRWIEIHWSWPHAYMYGHTDLMKERL